MQQRKTASRFTFAGLSRECKPNTAVIIRNSDFRMASVPTLDSMTEDICLRRRVEILTYVFELFWHIGTYRVINPVRGITSRYPRCFLGQNGWSRSLLAISPVLYVLCNAGHWLQIYRKDVVRSALPLMKGAFCVSISYPSGHKGYRLSQIQ